MNLLEKIKAKRPFIYEVSDGLVAIHGNKTIKVTDILAYEDYEKYKAIINKHEIKGDEIRQIVKKVSSRADFQCMDSYIFENKVVPGPGINHIKTDEYIDTLTEQDKENLAKQVMKYEEFYKEYINKQGFSKHL